MYGIGSMWVRHVQCLGWPWTRWQNPHVMCPQWFVDRSPDRVCEGIIGSASLWYVPNPGCYSPSSSLPLSHAAHLSILDSFLLKKVGFFDLNTQSGEAGCSLACSNFPLWVKSQAREGGVVVDSPDTELGGRVMWVRWNCSSFSLQFIQCWLFSPFNSVLEFLCWTPGLSQRYSCPCVIVKITFWW